MSEAHGIDLFNLAGFEVKLNVNTFRIFREDKLMRGYSERKWLTDRKFVMKQIIDIAFADGMKFGTEKTQKDFRKLLGIENEKPKTTI